MYRGRNLLRTVLIRWAAVLLVLALAFVVFATKTRPALVSYAKTRATAIMVAAFDDAVKSAIEKLDYSYDDMAVISRNSEGLVSSIEIDYRKLNILRAEISSEVYKKMGEKSQSYLYIPIGTLLGNEYTAGYGPRIKFKMQYLQIPRLDFESSFYAAGINNVFHRININADLSYSIVMNGVDETFSVNLTTVAAQTVIAGAVPENFTNVVETPNSNVADDIFNYANK